MIKYPKVRILLTFASLLAASATFGAPDDVVVQMSNGSDSYKADLSKISRITFRGSSMIIKAAGEPDVSIPVRNIERMVFDLNTSSAEEMESALSEDLTFIVEHKKVRIVSATGGDVQMHVFDASGRQVDVVSGASEAEYDFSDKNTGVYIITSSGKSIKYLNK
ncbi:MAG: T9SS type A sorting domain-containing protein [Muribaculaceae bacterium]|nr:T9SS type A sorting domain-containing protein [Muribaculaceae bacterium]